MADGPENLTDILAKLFTARGWGRKSERVRLESAWAEAVGPARSADTRVAAMRRGVLEVEVKNGVLLQELAQFHKRQLLTDLRRLLPGTAVTDLKFRAAAW
jgi:predicted nucleic acid-binding Zn ribbon protein